MSWCDVPDRRLDPPEDDDIYADERAEYYAELAADADLDIEAAARANDELLESLEQPGDEPFEPSDYTPEPPTLTETWAPAERGELQAKLKRLGATITELSDARELCGLPRLSRVETTARKAGWLWLLSKAGRTALAAVRAERALLLEQAAHPGCAPFVPDARRALKLKTSLKRMRLGELREVVRAAMRACRNACEHGRAA